VGAFLAGRKAREEALGGEKRDETAKHDDLLSSGFGVEFECNAELGAEEGDDDREDEYGLEEILHETGTLPRRQQDVDV